MKHAKKGVSKMRLPKHLALLILLILFATGCGYLTGQGEFASGTTNLFAVNEQIYATCTDQCKTQAQCGIAPDNRTMVFGHVDIPATQKHTSLILNNAPLRVTQSQPQQMIREIDKSRLEVLNFYRVAYTDPYTNASTEAWIAGWCVANQRIAE